jgi:hypothetical protein
MKHIIAGAVLAAATVIGFQANAADLSGAEIQSLLAPGSTLKIAGVGMLRKLDNNGQAEVITMAGRNMTTVFVRDDKLCMSDFMLPGTAGVKGGGTTCAKLAAAESGKLQATYDSGKVAIVEVISESTSVAAVPSTRMLPKVK